MSISTIASGDVGINSLDSSLVWPKAEAAVLSFLLACFGCSAARHLEQGRSKDPYREMLLSAGNTFAAGILLAASLTHMLPDAMKALEHVSSLPLAPMAAGTAFCLLVILGEVLGEAMPKREEPHSHTACVAYEASFALWPRMELVPPHGCDEASAPAKSCCESASPFEANFSGHGHSHGSSHGHGHKWSPQLVPKDSSQAVACGITAGHSCHSHSSCCKVHRHSDAPCSIVDAQAASSLAEEADSSGWLGKWLCHKRAEKEVSPRLTSPLLFTAPLVLPPPAIDEEVKRSIDSACGNAAHEGPEDSVSRCHVRTTHGGSGDVKSYLLFFALSFHSVMEGLGMGSAQNERLFLPVVVAILAHKVLAAFALGCSLNQSDLPNWKFWVFVLLFAVGTPLGCFMGMATVALERYNGNSDQSVASGVCIALASGTFLQVSSMELLPRVLAEENNKILASFMLFLGFILMSLLAIWV